jgi:RNA polymerase sigma factor (sigma-70 family)
MTSLSRAALRLVEPGESPSPSWDDERLVEGCRDGDQQAWGALVRKSQRLVYAVAFRYHAAPEDAADIFQSVCVELYSELDQIRQPAALRGWLITVTSHTALRWRRLRTRRDHFERPDDPAVEAAEVEPTVEADREALELGQELREAMQNLPDRCQSMLQMLFFDDPPKPYAEVATQLGLATGSIGFIRGRCLDKLRKAVTRHERAGEIHR